MENFEAVLGARKTQNEFLAVYQDSNAMDQIGLLCTTNNLRFRQCFDISTAMSYVKNWKTIDTIAIDVRLAEQNNSQFLHFMNAHANTHQVYVTYHDSKDPIIQACVNAVRECIQGSTKICTIPWGTEELAAEPMTDLLETGAVSADLKHELPGLGTDLKLQLPGLGTDLKLELPGTETGLKFELPGTETDLKLELPGTGTESEIVSTDLKLELPGTETETVSTDLKLELAGSSSNEDNSKRRKLT